MVPIENKAERQRAFAVVALLADTSEPEKLLSFLPEDEAASLRPLFTSLAGKAKQDKKQTILDELRGLSYQSRRSWLSEVHGDWVVQALKDESPQMIATILRYLPGNHVRIVLEKLSPRVLSQMPPLSQTFSAAPELVQALKKKFEQKFAVGPSSFFNVEMNFDILPALPSAKLELLFRELGLRELAMAFATLNEKTAGVLLQRMPPRDASLLGGRLAVARLKKQGARSDERFKQAQAHLLALDLEAGSADHMLMEAGFFLYSKAVLPSHLEGLKVIEQKFPMERAAALRRYVEKNLPLNSDKTVLRYQQEIGEALKEIKG